MRATSIMQNLERKLEVTQKPLHPTEAKALADATATLGRPRPGNTNPKANADTNINADTRANGNTNGGPNTDANTNGETDGNGIGDTNTDPNATSPASNKQQPSPHSGSGSSKQPYTKINSSEQSSSPLSLTPQQAHAVLQAHAQNPNAPLSEIEAQRLDQARKVRATAIKENLERKQSVTQKALPPIEARALADALELLGKDQSSLVVPSTRSFVRGLPIATKGMGSRGERNRAYLTDDQQNDVYRMVEELGLNPKDVHISHNPSAYKQFSDFDYIQIGPNAVPVENLKKSNIFERLSLRSAIAHEGGHLLTTRDGKGFAPGSFQDEIIATIVGRQMPSLSSLERYQMLRYSVELAREGNINMREFLNSTT